MLVMERLRHPNIVACYGGGEDADGSLYYLMELIDGGTVKALLQMQQRMHWSVVVELGRQICSALQCAHNNGVVHRDLKPGNLFLNLNAELKLGDFGIARDLTNADLTSSGMTVGTHGYMAPEQITGDAGITGKADLYSLGCCLFEMLTGQSPFTGENFALLFEQHLRAIPRRVKSLVPDCPDELDSIVNQLLAKKPDDRPFNARQVQGVMIKLGDQSADQVGSVIPNYSGDIGAGSVAALGHDLLVKQITARIRGSVANDVSWVRLATMVAVLALIVVFAILLHK
jgi:serine/threonine protein kinase